MRSDDDVDGGDPPERRSCRRIRLRERCGQVVVRTRATRRTRTSGLTGCGCRSRRASRAVTRAPRSWPPSLLAQDSKVPRVLVRAGGQGGLQPGTRAHPPRERRDRRGRHRPGARSRDPQVLEGLVMTRNPRLPRAGWTYMRPELRHHLGLPLSLRPQPARPRGRGAARRRRLGRHLRAVLARARCTSPRARPTSGTSPSVTAGCWRCAPASWSVIAFPTASSSPIVRSSTPATSHGRKIADREVVADVLQPAGVDADFVLAEIDGGEPLDVVRKEHEAAVADFDVWGVPTVIAGDGASFVRVMNDAGGDPRRLSSHRSSEWSTCSPAGPSSTSSSTPRSRR